MKSPFVIFSLPRSRSYWLSQYLSHRDWSCGHDQARYVRGLDDVRCWLSQEMTGTVETAVSPYWRLMLSIRPDIRVVTIRRPVDEVVQSAMAVGDISDPIAATATMQRLDHKLDQIEARIPGVLSVRYGDLADESTCAELFEHCLPYDHDSEWWWALKNTNLQINLPALARYEAAHSEQLRVAKSICDQESRSLLWRDRKVSELDGMTFQEETLCAVLRDGRHLLEQHCADIGEATDSYLGKNLPLMERLEEGGALQIMTARANGRMFGYLQTVIGPSLETTDPDYHVGTQTTFYCSHDARGIGLRLQRASIAALKARGGKWEIQPRAGIRGSGPKMGILYRRLGAESFGELFRLKVA